MATIQPISNSDRLQDLGVRTSNLDLLKTKWVDTDNVSKANEILSKLELQANRMSHGYDRHGFERGHVTHFKAKEGDLFDEKKELESKRRMNKSALTTHENNKTDLQFFNKRNKSKLPSRMGGFNTITKSLYSSNDGSIKQWKDDSSVNLSPGGGQREISSKHFDIAQLPLNNQAFADKFNRVIARHLTQKSRHQNAYDAYDLIGKYHSGQRTIETPLNNMFVEKIQP